MEKIVKTSTGIKRIEDSNQNASLFRLREIMEEQRNGFITRLETDLPSYILYKFSKKVDIDQLNSIKDRLHSLKNNRLNIDEHYYSGLVNHFINNNSTYLNSEPFYKEIDEAIDKVLHVPQLKLVN